MCMEMLYRQTFDPFNLKERPKPTLESNTLNTEKKKKKKKKEKKEKKKRGKVNKEIGEVHRGRRNKQRSLLETTRAEEEGFIAMA